MNIVKTLLVIPMALLVSMPVLAHQYGDDGYSRFDQRIERQKSRIRGGFNSGELTRKEAADLRKQQSKIAKLERKFSRDGELTRHERKKLDRRQDMASEKIYELKHNDRDSRHHLHHKSHRGHGYGYRRSAYDGWALVLSLGNLF